MVPLITNCPPSSEDGSARETCRQYDNGNQPGKEPQDTQSQIFRLFICRKEFFVFRLLGIDHADQCRTEYTFINHFIQPVDDLTALS